MAKRKEEIMDEAIKIIASKGYHKTHVADIVEAVGIAKGTFYLYFNSKKDLFLALIKKYQDIFENRFDIDKVADQSYDLKSFLAAFLSEVIEINFEYRDLTIIILREAVTVDNDFNEEYKKMSQQRFKHLKSLFKYLQAKKYLKFDDFNFFACVFTGILDSMIMKRLVLNEEELNQDQITEKAADYLSRALR
ncbi:MAG: TetR/AcrR family transcriptional regulator [Halanaerobium sp.]